MKQFALRAALAATFAFPCVSVLAQDHSHHHAASAPAPARSAALSEGTVKKLEKSAGKITLVHGPLENLGMPAMTMTFDLKPGAAPSALKEGDKVRFRAEEKDGRYQVVRIEAAK